MTKMGFEMIGATDGGVAADGMSVGKNVGEFVVGGGVVCPIEGLAATEGKEVVGEIVVASTEGFSVGATDGAAVLVDGDDEAIVGPIEGLNVAVDVGRALPDDGDDEVVSGALVTLKVGVSDTATGDGISIGHDRASLSRQTGVNNGDPGSASGKYARNEH